MTTNSNKRKYYCQTSLATVRQLSSSKSRVSFNDVKSSFKIPATYQKLHDLLFSNKIKIAGVKGGRGGGKTNNIILAMLIINSFNRHEDNKYSLLIREYKTLLKKEQLQSNFAEFCSYSTIDNLIDFFRFQDGLIINKLTNHIIHAVGLRDYKSVSIKNKQANLDKIKNYNYAKLVCIEEASSITKDALSTLIPTLRTKTPPLVTFAYNPVTEADDIYSYFNGRADAVVEHINIFDLEPEFQSPTLLKEIEQDKLKLANNILTQEHYDHTWYGAPNPALRGRPFEYKNVIQQFPTNKELHMFIDPSLKGVDYTAVAVGYADLQADDTVKAYIGGYLFQASIDKAISSGMIDWVIDKHNIKYGGYEDNIVGFDLVERLRNKVEFAKVHTTQNKEQKIYSTRLKQFELVDLQPASGEYGEFVKQVKEYSVGAEHDDAPDSVAMFLDYIKYNTI